MTEAEKASRNEVAVRSTEGPRTGEPAPESRHRRPRGRPKGSANKPKSLVPKELASELLLIMKDQLPPEHFEYMKSVIKDGGAISTKQELDTMLLLLGRNLYPFLVAETQPQPVRDVDGNFVYNAQGEQAFEQPEFRKDVTERLKVWKSLLDTRAQIEKNEKPEEDGESPVLKLWASRGMQGRLAVLVQGMNPDGPEPTDGSADDGDAGRSSHLLGDSD